MDRTGHRQQGRGRRVGGVFMALVQFALAGFVPAADAALEEAPGHEPVHVEAPSDGACEAHSDHPFCQLCRALTLTGGSASPPGAPAPAPAAWTASSWADALPALADAGRFGALGSRAPPLA